MNIKNLTQAAQLAAARTETLDIIARLDDTEDDEAEWVLTRRTYYITQREPQTFHVDRSVVRGILERRLANLEMGLAELGVSV